MLGSLANTINWLKLHFNYSLVPVRVFAHVIMQINTFSYLERDTFWPRLCHSSLEPFSPLPALVDLEPPQCNHSSLSPEQRGLVWIKQTCCGSVTMATAVHSWRPFKPNVACVDCTGSPDIFFLDALVKSKLRQLLIIPALLVQTDTPWMGSERRKRKVRGFKMKDDAVKQ